MKSASALNCPSLDAMGCPKDLKKTGVALRKSYPIGAQPDTREPPSSENRPSRAVWSSSGLRSGVISAESVICAYRVSGSAACQIYQFQGHQKADQLTNGWGKL